MMIRRRAAVPRRVDDRGLLDLPIGRAADPVDPTTRRHPGLEPRRRAFATRLRRVRGTVGIQEETRLWFGGPEQRPVWLAPIAAVEIAREYDAATRAQLLDPLAQEPGRFDPGL